ncbi:MAG: hypothetical protein WDN25_13645 [Acetobacteraceae bacterium]
MILGSVTVDYDQGAVHTHRDTYLLASLTVVSVRRPLLPFAAVAVGGMGGFTAAFGDLLYLYEGATIATLAATALLIGWQAGQLKLLSRDLRGGELSGAIWGQASTLNGLRKEIAQAVASARRGK